MSKDKKPLEYTRLSLADATPRDIFAAIVLAGLDCRGLVGVEVAARCYEIADAMIEQGHIPPGFDAAGSMAD